MHECQIFRKDLADLVLGSSLFDPDGAFAAELKSCEDCFGFYRDALMLAHIMDDMDRVADQSFENRSAGFSLRLRQNLTGEAAVEPVHERPIRRRIQLWVQQSSRQWGQKWGTPAAAAAAILAVVLVSWFAYRSTPLALPLAMNDRTLRSPSSRIQIVDDHIAGLDSETVAFIGQSELFLRDFTKIEPWEVVDLEDARLRARAQLTGIEDRRQAAATFPPVQSMLDEYEFVLRDIKNVDQASGDEVVEIQSRIARTGLIASMKVYQPRVVLVSSRPSR